MRKILAVSLILLFVGAATVAAQSDKSEGRGKDRLQEKDRDHELELHGVFNESRNASDIERFHALVSNITDDYEITDDSPERFHIEDLSPEECRELREKLHAQPYIARLSECGHDHDHDDDDHADKDKRERPQHPQNKTPQGRALGHDGQWHECRDEAGDNETARKECHDAAKERAIERHDRIKEARQAQKVGGEINISKDARSIDTDDGIVVTVDTEGDEDLRVEFDAELASGRTFVLDVDPALISGDSFEIRYYDIADDGTEVERPISEADSLDDILDPDNDDGPEYWVVEDPDGLHVMLSIDHWSVHAFGLEGVETQSTAIPGPSVLVVSLGLAGLVMVARRRS